MPELSSLGVVIARASAPYEDAQSLVLSRSLTAPPGGSTAGDRYIVAPPGIGAWSGHGNAIAEFTGSGWTFVAAREGISAWIHDESAELFFNGTSWGPNTPDVQRGIVPAQNTRMAARTTAADGARACDIAVAIAPIAGSRISVAVNGLGIPELGDGTKTGAACFFSRDGGQTPLALSAVTAGDVLYWIGSIAGYELDAASDVIDFVYEVA